MVRKSLLRNSCHRFCQNLMPFQTAAEANARGQVLAQLTDPQVVFSLPMQSPSNSLLISPVAQIYRVLGTAPFSFRTLQYSNTISIQCIKIYLEIDIGCLHQLSRKPTTKLFPLLSMLLTVNHRQKGFIQQTVLFCLLQLLGNLVFALGRTFSVMTWRA